MRLFVSGLSLKVLGFAFAGLCFCGWMVSTATGPLGWQRGAGVAVLAMAALAFFVLVLGLGALWGRLFGNALLSKAERLCLVYFLLFATPFMGLGFWVPAVSTASAPERRGAWALSDLFPEQLSPVGPNLLAPGRVDLAERIEIRAGEGSVGAEADGPLLALGTESGEGAVAVLPLALVADGLFYNTNYRFSARFRFEGPRSTNWVVRLRPDAEGASALDLVRGRGPQMGDITGPEGYHRAGSYGFSLPGGAAENVLLEVEVAGPGTLAMTEPLLSDVSALTQFKSGRPMVSQSVFESLPASERAGVSVRPDNLWSLAGLKYLIAGRIPWNFWATPILAWLVFFGALFGGIFALAVIMRRQWIDRERFPMPLTYPIVDLIGRPGTPLRAVPQVARNGAFWMGFAVAALFATLAISYAFNPGLPDPQPTIQMRAYFTGADWGDTWKFAFQVIPFVFAVGLLLELNISLSVVIGFLLFRLQYFLGEQTGWASDSDYPYQAQQFGGAALAYGLTLLYFTRRYLIHTAKIALRGEPQATIKGTMNGEGEQEEAEEGDDKPFGYRFGYGLLLLSAMVFLGWCAWLGLGLGGALILYATLLLLVFVLMRVRAECGIPLSLLGNPNAALLLVPVAGGLGFLGAEAFGMNHILGGILFGLSILVIAGMQVEFLELARQYLIRPWQVPATLALALVGGIVIGGWFFLSGHYAEGADNAPHATQYEYRGQKFADIGEPMGSARRVAAGEEVSAVEHGGKTAAFLVGGGVMVVLTVLRQLFAGFWFHPVGYLVGPFMQVLWGGLLLAWMVRLLVVKLGGAGTVREKLRPFAIGMIVALALFYMIGFAVNLYIAHMNPGQALFMWKMTPNQ